MHLAQRKVTDLQTHLKVLESKLAEKDTEIRLMQEKKSKSLWSSKTCFQHLIHLPFLACGSSFDSYNSFGLNPLSYNSQTSFNASNTSFNTTTNTSLLDQTYGGGGGGGGVTNASDGSNSFKPSSNNNISGGIPNPSYVPTQSGQQSYQPKQPTYQTTTNLQSLPSNMSSPSSGGGNYTPNSSGTSYSQQYDPQTYGNVSAAGGSAATLQNQTPSAGGYETSSYDNLVARSTSIDEHMKQQLDEQLLTKVSQMALEQVTKLLAEKQRELQSTSNIIRSQIQSSREILAASSGNNSSTTSARDLSDREEFCWDGFFLACRGTAKLELPVFQ